MYQCTPNPNQDFSMSENHLNTKHGEMVFRWSRERVKKICSKQRNFVVEVEFSNVNDIICHLKLYQLENKYDKFLI